MSLNIEVSENGRRRIAADDSNPRIYMEEWKCEECGEWVPDEEIVWALPDGTLNTDTGKPYCERCCPEQPEY